MKILYWNSESHGFHRIVDDLASKFELIEYEEITDSVDLALEEEVDAILFNYDDQRKVIDKALKKIKKNIDVKVFLHTNELNQKQLIKHQKSKVAGDLYLRSPIDKSLVISMVLPFYDGELELDEVVDQELSEGDLDEDFEREESTLSEAEKTIIGNVLEQHAATELSANPEVDAINNKLNDIFLSSFPLSENELNAQQIVSDIENKESSVPNDISLDEDDLLLVDDEISIPDTPNNLAEDDDDLLLVDDETSEEEELMSLDDNDNSDELLLDDELLLLDDSDAEDIPLVKDKEEDVLILEEEETINVDDELLFDVGEADDIEMAEEDLLVSNELEDSSIDEDELLMLDGDDNTEADINLSESQNENEAELSLGGIDLLTDDNDDILELGEEDTTQENHEEVGLEMSLDDDIDLDLGDDVEISTQEDEGLDLDLGDEVSLELGAEEESNTLETQENHNEIDLSSDSGDLIEEQTMNEESIDNSLALDDSTELDDSLSLDSLLDTDDESILDELEVEEDLSLEEDDSSFDEIEDEIQPEGTLEFNSEISEPVKENKIADQSLEFDLNSSAINELDEMDDPVDFSTEAKAKLAEIDAMMEDDSTDSLEDEIQDEMGELEDISFNEPTIQVETQLDSPTQIEVQPQVDHVENDSVKYDEELIRDHIANKGHAADQLATLGVTIKTLREDRETLLGQIQELELNQNSEKNDHLTLKAQLDERSIEVDILKNRYEKRVDQLKVELDISMEKKTIIEQKAKLYENEIEKLNKKVRIDLNKVKMRERELENKLEMLKSDSESQIRNRDLKILELKRKIDTLEFDLESIQVQGQKVVSNKYELEEKMEKVIDTLRGAIGDLEEDNHYTRKIKNIKNNLDV